MRSSIVKYPRTPHLEGSRLQPGDEDVRIAGAHELDGLPLVVEEKLDGSNTGISFDTDGALVLQSRGHVLTGGPRDIGSISSSVGPAPLAKRWGRFSERAT